MKTFIKNLNELAECTGYEEVKGENIGYGEMAVIFHESNCETIDEFVEEGEFGTYFVFDNKELCKVRNVHDDAIIVYEEDGHVYTF
jgi:hypothetical protein